MHHAATAPLPDGRHSPEITSTGPERTSRRDARGDLRSSRAPKKLQRNPDHQRTYSFSPGRIDIIRISPDAHRRNPVSHLPPGVRVKAATVHPLATNVLPPPLNTQPAMTVDNCHRVPTLHKRTAQDLTWRKSSKRRRKEDHDREIEVKAMSAMTPTRPATDSSGSGRPMKKDSKRMRLGLNHNLQNPSSDISLPTAESMHSSLSSKSNDSTSYVLSVLDMLTPRPTIRHTENPRYLPGASGFGHVATEPRRGRLSERLTISKEALRANKRVDDLADDLDAGDLRELMERDQRRREKKKIANQIKMERKLARRLERQEAEQAEAARTGTPPPPNMERGVLGRESVGLGIGTSAVVTSNKRRGSNASHDGRRRHPTEVYQRDSELRAHIAQAEPRPSAEREGPLVGTSQVGMVSKANVSPPPIPKGRTKDTSSISKDVNVEAVPSTVHAKPEPVGRSSVSPARPPQSWTLIFKRRSKTPRGGSTPSSFSNTSRDSMHRDSTTSSNAPAPSIGYTPVKMASNVPKRTKSKFREDLPELPISPPDSRVQSPEADEVPPIRKSPPKTGHGSVESDAQLQYETPSARSQPIDAMRLRNEIPTSGHRSVGTVSPEPATFMSQSLASIDSEGSWLSGRVAGSKRGSSQIVTYPLRDSASSLQKKYRGFSESAEELGIAEDEYFSRLTPGPDDQFKIHRHSTQSAGEPVPSSDDEEGSPRSPETKWANVVRHPTVVHHEARAKSREVFVGEYLEGGSSEPAGETPVEANSRSHSSDDDADVLQRATSIDLGQRRVSAGSARILDLKAPLSRRSSKKESKTIGV